MNISKSVMHLFFIGIFFLTIGITSCSKDDVPEEVTPSEKKITSFVFLLTENPINVNVIGQIDEGARTITAIMPEGTDVNGIIPSIEVSSGATVSPTTAQNFNNPVTYTVTGSDGSTANYTATVTEEVTPGEKKITSFVFLLTENPINVNVIGQIDEGAKTITAIMPEGTDLNGLIPAIEVSSGATVSPTTVQDFTNPVAYTVTGEDGNTATYKATVTGTLTQREILQIILDENPGNDLGWLIPNSGDLGVLEGVTTNINGDIIKLEMGGKIITVLPPEIGQLVLLEELDLQVNNLTSVPGTIGNLVNLTRLWLQLNDIVALPSEIGQLTQLTSFEIERNELTSLPPEIGHLTLLTELNLFNNQLSSLPPELGFLTELNSLGIDDNNLTSIPLCVCLLAAHNGLTIFNDPGVGCTSNPTELDALISIYAANPNNTLGWGVDNYPGVTIGTTSGIVGHITANNKNLVRIPGGIDAMTSLEVLNLNNNSFDASNALTPDIGNISSLTTITLASTEINTVPASFGNLTNLTLLLLTDNPITSIPQEVCDLPNLTILTDPGEGCD